MTRQAECKPTIVPFRAKQAGETRPPWWWVEPSVWTERMLATLANGVKGGVWFSLIDKVYSKRNLTAASAAVAANDGAAGVDRVTTASFVKRLPENLDHLHQSLQTGTYSPQAVRRAWIPKPGTQQQRPPGIPTVRDRVAQTALRNVLEPIFERDFAEQSYGFRPGRGCQDALARVDELLKAGYTYVVDADLQSYFDTIPHDKLLDQVGRKVADAAPRQDNGRSLDTIIADVNHTVRGWFGYFKPSHYTTFRRLDAWIRMRLRSILRRSPLQYRCGDFRRVLRAQIPLSLSGRCDGHLGLRDVCGSEPDPRRAKR